jgi:hypothetical protein
MTIFHQPCPTPITVARRSAPVRQRLMIVPTSWAHDAVSFTAPVSGSTSTAICAQIYETSPDASPRRRKRATVRCSGDHPAQRYLAAVPAQQTARRRNDFFLRHSSIRAAP